MALLDINFCPKCSTLMERRYRGQKHDKKAKKYSFTEWDYCPSCFFVQHYERYKIKKKKPRRPKKKKIKLPPKMTYRQYMGSAYWIKRKCDYFQAHGGKRCAICGQKAGVTLHHKRYNVHFGAEPDDALVMLCPRHHHKFHDNIQLKTNMTKESDLFVTTVRQLEASNIDDLSWV
jgi:hypothetical protein